MEEKRKEIGGKDHLEVDPVDSGGQKEMSQIIDGVEEIRVDEGHMVGFKGIEEEDILAKMLDRIEEEEGL